MAYNKKTRDELMNEELIEDKKRELSNEVSDGALDCWIEANYEDLIAEFLDDYNVEWVGYCRTKFNEENE